MLAEVDRALATPAQTANHAELQPVLEWARRQVHVIGWETDPAEYQVAWVLDYLLGQLHLRFYGAAPIGSVWNFTEH